MLSRFKQRIGSRKRSWQRKIEVTVAVSLILTLLTACGGAAVAPADPGAAATPGAAASAPAASSGATMADVGRGETLILQRGGNVINNFDQMNPYGWEGWAWCVTP
jgi:hypothetical protein